MDLTSIPIQYLIYGGLLFIILLGIIYWARRSKHTSPETIIGWHFHHCLNYKTSRYKGLVIQKWEISYPHRDSYLAKMKESEKDDSLNRMKKGLKEINKFGVNEPNNTVRYAGQISFSTCSKNADYPFTFSVDDYDRWAYLIGKLHLLNAVDSIKTMKRSSWTTGYLRGDLYYDYKGLDLNEAQELFDLVHLKNNFTSEVRKIDTWSPSELGFIHAYSHQNQIRHGTQEFIFEQEFEKLRDGIGVFEENPKNYLSINGVNIGSWYYYEGEGNFITIGGTRSGKGVNLIIPQLLNFEAYGEGSIVAIDIKGTLTAITARTLKENGFKTVILDPWSTQKDIGATHEIVPDSFNPLDIISRDPDQTIDDCDTLARIIIPVRQKTTDTHWDDKARQWVSTYLYYLVTDELLVDEERTLFNLRSLFKRTKAERKLLFENMIDGADSQTFIEDVKEIEDSFEFSEKESAGILSNIHRELDLFKSPPLQRALGKSTFDINDIAKGRMRLFISIDLEALSTHDKWLRLIITSVIMSIRRKPKEKVLMIVDEMFSIGHMEILEKSMSFMPEYKLQLWTIFQDLNQLKKLYPQSWETFIANSAVTTWLGLEGNETPEYLSRLISTKHIKYKKSQTVINELEGQGTHSPEFYEMPMQSALQLRMSDSIVARVKGHPKPFLFNKAPYYEDIILNQRADQNPLREKLG